MSASKVIVRIGTLKVNGSTQTDANTLSIALREALSHQLSSQTTPLGSSQHRALRVNVSSVQARNPTSLGNAAASKIARSLANKSGRRN